ncbi:redoxin family protein [Neisseriaceae bacterium PsAf]|nr:redoxin family protein [Neisseriaceae bacterium PsAf]MCV2503396.1 glutathione peroxidase [Neisseriaceae bacterium]
MSVYDFIVQDINGNDVSLKEFKNQVILIVNTASKCGFTPQFEKLEHLYQKYKDQGFTILGFPCNQFANQDPGNNQEIMTFCQKNYGVTFPMFSKIEVNGKDESPLYTYLKSSQPGLLNEKIKWNFTKFLINRDGSVVKRFAPTTSMDKVEKEIKLLL